MKLRSVWKSLSSNSMILNIQHNVYLFMRFNLRSLILISILLFFLPAILVAQRYPFTSVTLKDGLPQSSVYGIVQDTKGYIWFSTGGGVCRYDGLEFKYYTYYSGLEAGHTQDISIDANGKIWVATFGKG